jgi:tRNA threonylcarbamoyladenosine biosynthesis protein TsaE
MRPFANLREQAVDVRGSVHPSILETRTETWSDEAACASSAARLASHPALRNAIVELHGPLGAGKTSFVRALLRALGVAGRIKSPTYAVMEPYAPAGLPAWHFDFYRFTDPREWEDAGFRELFTTPGLKISEWPEKAEGLLPEPDLAIHIEPRHDESRLVRFDAHSDRGRELLA